MRFRDIEQFTRPGNYQVNVSLLHIPRTLEDYKTDFGLEMNPDFQRGNVWTPEQQTAYMEFFLKGGKTGKVIYFNHPNFIGFGNKDTDVPNMLLVDGLQRLTAVLGFLENEVPVFGGYYFKDFEDKPRLTEYDLVFNVNNLQYRKDVLKWYIEMNSGGTVHSTEEIERVKRLLEAETHKSEKEPER